MPTFPPMVKPENPRRMFPPLRSLVETAATSNPTLVNAAISALGSGAPGAIRAATAGGLDGTANSVSSLFLQTSARWPRLCRLHP
ncbi:JM163 [macacine gammaherpesvirus 11]|uniref:JM163 n=2 Tax=macacine gammaherpesvirus 11 TaxID=2560570 RepID=G9JMH0_9GAMA|nr:JM163 [Macaca fuscata rhadinovirus]AAT00140.1 JM163 [Macaca fuscata rhadinovirus]AEW87687.1 JM163 [Macaca fuscata rhadinovirus]AEW87857.1 JM163 [Macaca fuscata rhadinovirus]